MKHAMRAAPPVAALSLLFAIPHAAQAQAAAAGAGILAGASMAQSASQAEPGRELEDWKDPRTGVTSRLFNACSHLVELRLFGSSSRNYLQVMLQNESMYRTSFAQNQVVADFSRGPRRVLQSEGAGDVLDPGWFVRRTLTFPSKADFEGQTRITVRLPITFTDDKGERRDCEIEAVMDRARGSAPDASTYTEHTRLDLWFEGGMRFNSSLGQRVLGAENAGIFGGGVTFFPHLNHGAVLDVFVEAYGRPSDPRVRAGLTEPWVSATGLFLGYSFRVYPTRSRLALSYTLSGGPYDISLRNAGEQRDVESETYLAFRQRIRLDVPVVRLFGESQIFIGPTLNHLYVPAGSFRTIGASGHGLGATLALTMGY